MFWFFFCLSSFNSEAKFHTVVDRKPLRLENEAWQRVAMSESRDIPAQFQAWVNAPTNTAAQKTDEASSAVEPSATTVDAATA
jgi:hypothetical protein